jgi:LuxR family maltose regulon positive regulatory protein
VIEILILQSLAHQAHGDQPNALAALERALTLAEPEGYVRIFADEGEAMRMLIADFRVSIETQMTSSAHAQRGYTGKLLAAFERSEESSQRSAVGGQKKAVSDQPSETNDQRSAISNQQSPLLEPLSERELEVLRLLRSELSGPEIAQQLVVSLNTLRTHTKNIFSKLGVNNRRAAVRRAEELGML